MKKITVDGNEFKSFQEACRYYNVGRKKVESRIKNGWTIEEAFELTEHIRPNKGIPLPPVKTNRAYTGDKVIVNGKSFLSCKDACRYYGISYDTAMKRLERGYSIEEVFNPNYKNKCLKEITVEGKTFKSIAEACKYYNITRQTVAGRLKMGWTIEETFEIKKKSFTCLKIGIKEFSSYAEACRYYGVKKCTFRKRLEYGWTIREALEVDPREDKRYRPIDIKGKTFANLKEACSFYGISTNTVQARISKGWTKEDAICTPSGLPNPALIS